MSNISGAKIGVVCAFNVANAGMYSVDLAAQQFFSDLGIDFDLIVTQSRHKAENEKYGRIPFRVIRDSDKLFQYDLVVYWGDFLNNPVYGSGDFARREVRLYGALDTIQGYDFWKSIMLGDPSGRVPSISVSNNMQGLFGGPETDPEISKIYESRFHSIFPRDPLGTQRVKNFSPSSNVSQGIDAAFLLDHSNLGIDLGGINNKTFCTFFARSKIKKIDQIITQIEQNTGLKAVSVDDWFSCGAGRSDRVFKEMISAMSRAQFIISDTYHFCVNSLTLGIPVVSIGRDTTDQVGTLGDHKKKTLFDMFGLGSSYVTTTHSVVREQFAADVYEAIDAVRSATPQRVPAVNEAIHNYRNLLKETIFQALA